MKKFLVPVRNLGLAAALAASLVLGVAVGRATADQPHMQNAKAALNTALAELQLAEANKGGHRDRAIELVNEALTQVQLGIDYAR